MSFSTSFFRFAQISRAAFLLVGTIAITICFPLIGNAQSGTAVAPKAPVEQEPAEEQEMEVEEGFESIFDGETLEGWTGNPDLWSVEEGAITGTTTKESNLKFNQFITWDQEVADFELRCLFKIESESPKGGNSGIQYRSKAYGEEGQHRISGYQADIDATMRFMGILFEERGRKILCQRGQNVEITEAGKKNVVGRTGEEADIVAAIDPAGWNEYVIRAQGNHITQSINGQVTAELTDNEEAKAAPSGLLSFQIHVGPPMRVQFKNIRIKNLAEEE